MKTKTSRREAWFRLTFSVALLAASGLHGQEYTFTTLAGLDESPGAIDGIGDAARFNRASGVAIDTAGNLYVADSGNHTIRKVTPDRRVTTLAGLAGNPGTNDGTGVAARFNSPSAVAVDNSGNVFVADTDNFTIRGITPAGTVTTIAGMPGQTGTNDGPGIKARFSGPRGLEVDGAGVLFVADTDNHAIRGITPDGFVTTLAGLPGSSGTNDGPGGTARFSSPFGVAVDTAGNLYVADTGNNTIRLVTPAGVVTTIAGSAGIFGSADGVGTEARFIGPYDVAVDIPGNVYVADSGNDAIRKITPDREVTTLAGQLAVRGYVDAAGSDARFHFPHGVAVDGAGNVFVAEVNTAATGGSGALSTIRMVTADGMVTTIVGRPGAPGYADGTGTEALFYYPKGIAVDAAGTAYVTDYLLGAEALRQVTPDGTITSLTSVGQLGRPNGVALDGDGNLYVADDNEHTIRKRSTDGTVTVFAGLAGSSGSANGTGSAARFKFPLGVAVDSGGNVFVADSGNNTIRKITPTGLVTTLAGRAGTFGTNDGTGSAARFSYPNDVVVDNAGNVFVADLSNFTIRRITPQGVVTTVAGLGGSRGSDDGMGSAARFQYLGGLAIDNAGNLFAADYLSIRKITPQGAVTTLASGKFGTMDGTGGSVQFKQLSDVAMDGKGNLYVVDRLNHSIRFGTTACPDLALIDFAIAPVGLKRQLDTSPNTAVAWQWTQIRQPANSSAKLSAIDVPNPTFTPDVPDLYVFRLYATNAVGARCIRTVSLNATVQPVIVSSSLVRTNGELSFTLLSQTNRAVEIQASTDLASWPTLATLTNLLGTLAFTETNSTSNFRFYRARQLQ
jgi:sugar lactone lactonase YvrE